MIPWIAEKPWKFAYDPGRQTFLATEDIHFYGERDYAFMIEPQKVDAQCRRALSGKLKDKLPALDALLAAFAR